MDEEDRELLREHSRLIKELQEDFQKFFKVMQKILPEIEETRTLHRIEQDRKDFLSRNHTGLV
jgi:succinate dehydrogenase/fumarate reductase-like Fe-S protein